MFKTLNPSAEGRKRRGVAFVCGLLAEALVIGGAISLGALFPNELPVTDKHYALTWLRALMPPEKPVEELPLMVARVFVPKMKSPEIPKLLAPSTTALEVLKIRPTVSSELLPTIPMPASAVAQPNPVPKEQIAVHTGLFGGAPERVTTKRPVDEVQTGGFGSPQGLPGPAQSDDPGNLPKLGSFELPERPGAGNGTGGRHGIQGVVASAGFGSGVAGTGYGRGDGGPGVAIGGFEKARQVAQVQAESLHLPPPVDSQPVEILSKPAPTYTEEARRLRIQGEVTLSVVFLATGGIRVIGVAKSLGHGLDEAAERAATQIRFKPALRDGQPADFPATLRIQFRLADQST
jgi:TonB family protein